MGSDIEFGVLLWNIGESEWAHPEAFRRVAETTEEQGFDALWGGDHVIIPEEIPHRYPFHPDGAPPFDSSYDVYEVFETLSYLAGITDRVRLGTNTCIAPYRHPVLLARQALSLAALAEGRFDFGIGVGWLETEFEVLDVPFEERGSRTDEFLDLFERVREKGELSFDGPHHSFQRTGFHPIPDDDVPVWIGGGAEATFRRVAEFGDGWTTFWASPEDVAETRERIVTKWNDHGRDGTPGIAVFRPVSVGADADRLLYGSADEIIEDVEAYAEAGATRLLVSAPTPDVDEQVRQIERLGSEVLPSFA